MSAAVIEMREPCPCSHPAAPRKGVIVTDAHPWIVRCATCSHIVYRLEELR